MKFTFEEWKRQMPLLKKLKLLKFKKGGSRYERNKFETRD